MKNSTFFQIRILLASLAILLVLPVQTWAEDEFDWRKVTLTVLPFQVNAEPDLAYLNESLPVMLSQKLEDYGFQITPQEKVNELIKSQKVKFLDLATARDLALLGNAQYAVYGSFSQVGESISIDARLVEGFGIKEPKALFGDKKGLINLGPAVDQLAEDIKYELQLKERISSIEVKGNDILEKDVVFMRLGIQPGDLYNLKKIDEELRKLYALGYFDDIQIDSVDSQDGKEITFTVKEKPRIQSVQIEGVEELDEDDVLEAISSKPGSIINPKLLAEDMQKITELYRKEGYYKAKVSYNLKTIDSRQDKIIILVDEGKKLFIQNITIQGAKQLDPDDIKDELSLETRGMFSWLTGTGVLKEELLDRDAAAIEAYYGNRGFLDVRVGLPVVKFEDEGIDIIFQVEEGDRYKVGEVTFSGDLLVTQQEHKLVTALDNLAEDEDEGYFDRSKLREDIQSLSNYYSNYGYAYAQADADLKKNQQDLTVDVTYRLSTGPKVYVRRVTIQGNTKTRDNVIRREMRLSDGQVYNGGLLRRSNQRLIKVDYFETVDIETVPTNIPSQMDLVVKVKEKNTGAITAGAGYSTYDKLYFTANVQERNLFGKGYTLAAGGSIGARIQLFDVSFWNPRVYDSELGMGVVGYARDQDYYEYRKESFGGQLKFAYPLGEYTYAHWNYRLEKYRLYDVEDDAPDWVKERVGENWASSLFADLSRDTTNRRLNPSRGTINTGSIEYAGGILGGDDAFVKFLYDSTVYYPLFWETIFHWHGRIGYVMQNGEDGIPSFERFYLGGMNSVRGYEAMRISPRDEDGVRIGGNKEAFVNFEYIFPLNQELGIQGVTFFDAGQVWDDSETMNFDWYKSVGAGLRWYSPLGPLRLELGYALDRDDQAEGGTKLEFSVGQFY